MSDQDIQKKFKKGEGYLKKRLLKDAFDVISDLCDELNTAELKGKLEQYQTTYKFMLKYTVDGVTDPERDKIYMDLITSTYHLLDEVTSKLLTKQSGAFAYAEKRKFLLPSEANIKHRIEEIITYYGNLDLAKLDEQKKTGNFDYKGHFDNLTFFFDYFWLTDFYKEGEIKTFTLFLNHVSIPYVDKCLLVSALTLSLMRCFDEAKFVLLLDYVGNNDDEVGQRAIFGALINLYIYDQRLMFFPEIKNRLNLLSDQSYFIRSVERMVIQLIRSKETEKLTKKMKEEILPEMIKMNPFISDKLNLDNLLKDDMIDAKNPDWKDMLDEIPGLSNKLEEISDLQMEGADVFMGTFAMLKSFPFFNSLVNWFIPFTVEHPDLQSSFNDELNSSFVKALTGTRFMCNSDKYSFVMSVQQIPSSYKDMMSQSLNAELGQMEELTHEETALNPNKQGEKISNQYIQDFYRFSKLHPQKSSFGDLFAWRLDFHNKTFFKNLIADRNIWRNIGEYYFAKNYFVEALEVFDILLKEDGDNVEILQKAGYALQLLGDYKEALKYYLKADLIRSQNFWTLNKIAYCYRQLQQSNNALVYYRQAEIIDRDNLAIQLKIGHCLLDQKKYDEALKCYFRVEYLSPENTKVWKPIAWCSFVSGKMDQAVKYYKQILVQQPGVHDYINYGHVKWVLNDRPGALELYKQSIVQYNFEMEQFMAVFNVDKPLLIDKGIDPDEVPIMLDRLRYDLQA